MLSEFFISQMLAQKARHIQRSPYRIGGTNAEQAQAALEPILEPVQGRLFALAYGVNVFVIKVQTYPALQAAEGVAFHQGGANQLRGGHVGVLLMRWDFSQRGNAGVVQLTFTAPVGGKAEVVVVTASVGQVNAADIGNL